MDWEIIVIAVLAILNITQGILLIRRKQLRKDDIGVDPLTHLKTRGAFDEWVKTVTPDRRRPKTTAGNWQIAFIDLNKFKMVNDTFGHAVGDRALRLTAIFFTTLFRRDEDLVIRWGGDEFLIITRSSNTEDRLRTAQEVFQGRFLEKNLPQVVKKKIPFSFSFGVEELPERPTQEEIQLGLHMIDTKMYEQKGRR